MPIIGCTSKDNCKRDAFFRAQERIESGIGISDTRALHSRLVVSRHAAL
jgi:hypothetical protein